MGHAWTEWGNMRWASTRAPKHTNARCKCGIHQKRGGEGDVVVNGGTVACKCPQQLLGPARTEGEDVHREVAVGKDTAQ